MTTTDLQQLLASKSWRAEFMVVQDGSLRIFLQDADTGQVGLLAIEPSVLVLPDEAVLDYLWQDVGAELGPPPEECLITDLKTKQGPDFDKGEMPPLFS